MGLGVVKHKRMQNWLSIVCVSGLLGAFGLGGAAAADELEIDPAELTRPEPLEPAEARAAFVIKSGFRVELAAAEPQVVDPVAITFDERGALYVVEMRDYSERRAEALSRVKKLTDEDGDGFFETATVFLEGLAWATGVTCADGGVYVLASPDLIFAKDTDGDGVADERRVVWSGFGAGRRLNVQALPNSLTFGPDNRVWGATAGNGGSGHGLALTGHDFSFALGGTDMRAETGTAQFGLTFDSLGRRYVCSNSAHIQWVVFERTAGVGALRGPSRRIVDIPVDGPAAEVFRISPEEGWRVVRTRWRAAGVLPGIVEGGGRSSGYFTSASGLGAYTGHLFPAEFRDNIFVGDVGSNLLHRKILRETLNGPVAERPADEKDTEFLASPDNWFRPVAVSNGPDGALYVVDMYREIVEHPDSLPPNLKSQLDLNSGNDRGRLWRIVPEGVIPARRFDLASLDAEGLAALLFHDNGWHRATARRLLLERRAREAVTAISREAVSRGRYTADALAALSGLGGLTTEVVRAALQGSEEAAILWALRWLEQAPEAVAALEPELAALVQHTAPAVRWQLAVSLAAFDVPSCAAWRAALWQAATEAPLLREALLAGLRRVDEVWALWTVLPQPAEELAELLARAGDARLTALAVKWLLARPEMEQELVFRLAARLAPARPAHEGWPRLVEAAKQAVEQTDRALGVRQAAVRLLVVEGGDVARQTLSELVRAAATPDPLRLLALPALSEQEAPGLFAQWRSLSPAVREAVLTQAVARTSWHAPLLKALQQKQLAARELTAGQTAQLRALKDPALREQAWAVLGEPPPDRQAEVKARLGALKLKGDPAKGEITFRQRCLICHRHGQEGAAVGPDRVSFRSQGPGSLLLNLIDPNREVAPRYFSVQVTTADGETYIGLLQGDDDRTLTLLLPGGQQVTLERSRVASLDRHTRSLMPEGLEAGLSDQDIADLVEFLRQ